MIRRGWAVAGRVAVALLAGGAGLLAWRAGGGAEAPPTPPRPAEAAARDGGAGPTPKAAAKEGDTYEVAARLVDLAKDARFDIAKDQATTLVLGTHWRKMKPPFLSLSGDAAKYVTSIALRTSATETQWAMAQGSGKTWTPDARTWNMNEGSFDQREALVSPGASTITFKLAIPAGARLSFSEGTVNATRDATVFTVTVIDQKGAAHEVHRDKLPPSAARRWTDRTVDLSEFAGQSVELRLATSAVPAAPEEKKPAPKRKPATAVASALSASVVPGAGNAPPPVAPPDGGAVKEDALAVPGIAVALWGNPVVLTRATPKVPYNVLWIVVDALRPDVLASFHDDAEDAAKLSAKHPPLEALLPKVPGLTPAIDELTQRGVRFTHAYSAAAWTRPGTLAMLSGARSSELGIDTTSWVLSQREVSRFYASDPPLLSLLLRRHDVTTRAFVNNYFMVGYAPIGLDMGFERVADHRYRTRDTLEVTQDATGWIKENKDTRFFLFVNYNSPHEPYEPPKKLLERVPPPPAGPKDAIARLYMAEAAKDDEAIGVLMSTLEETGLRDRTIIVLTADHGETMSSAHQGTSGLEKMPIRYHHAVSNFEETTRVPIVVVAPGLLPAGAEVKARVRSIDIVPTITELLGLEQHPRSSGKSLVRLAKGESEPDERVVVSEGRGTRAIMHGKHRLLVREGGARITIRGDKTITAEQELFDLSEDPGERHDLAPSQPQLVLEMKARLDAALKNVPVAGSAAAVAATPVAPGGTLRLRFVGGGQARRVSGTLLVGDAKTKAKTFDVLPVEIGRDAFKIDGTRIELALTTTASASVGFDVTVDPPGVPVTWDLYLDDQPWPEEAVFGGPYGLLAPVLRRGVMTDEARAAAGASLLPPIDPRRDSGLFVVRERRGDPGDVRDTPDEGAEEMARLLKEWGYAHGSGGSK